MLDRARYQPLDRRVLRFLLKSRLCLSSFHTKADNVPDQPSADVKLRQLQILREVLRTGSARYAARLLKVSQPAVSQHIKQLEATLGFPLFLREKNRLVPTHQAWELLRDIEVAELTAQLADARATLARQKALF